MVPFRSIALLPLLVPQTYIDVDKSVAKRRKASLTGFAQ
jgi:hypothetical protein